MLFKIQIDFSLEFIYDNSTQAPKFHHAPTVKKNHHAPTVKIMKQLY
jgi:hypothetical protein